MAKNGVGIDLKESRKSVEQALRELKILMDPEIDALKERKYYIKPAKMRREKAKKKRANINRYNKSR